MNNIVKISSLFFLIAISSCYEKEVYSDIPVIEFDDIIFYDGEFVDSLVLSFGFEDGGGDIGLVDQSPPYHIFSGIADSLGRFVFIDTPADSLKPPFYSIPIESRATGEDVQYFQYPTLAKLYSEEDVRKEYNCEEYFKINGDTLFVERNVYYNNIYIVFERKVKADCGTNPEDCYEEIEIPRPDCDAPDLNARIPFFESDAQKGVIKYNIQSRVLRLTFPDDILRIKFWIYDRGLNQSNIAYTKDFTFEEITQ